MLLCCVEINFFEEDLSEVLPINMHGWPLIYVEDIPMQDTPNDCGVFVLLYMKTLVGKTKIDWGKLKVWSKHIEKLRAEFAIDLINTFHRKVMSK